MAVKIRPQPSSSRGVSLSPKITQPAITLNTDSRLMISEATVGFSLF